MTRQYPIILHHFEKSPFSEKIRIVFGLKKIAWTSVLIPRIMPRPDLMPMTGGYRRTPTLQIGADIFCDTQIIIRELERRFPEPTLFPDGNAGLPWSLGMWTDRSFFQNTVNLVFGTLADQVPKEFREDREQLRGQKFDVDAMKAAIPQMRDQLRAHVDWIEAQLGDGRSWLLGGHPSLGDVSAYMNIWYVRGNLADAENLFVRFPKMLAWEQRVKAIGHGSRERELTSADALEIARKASPQTATGADAGDLNGRKPGDRVKVIPDDYGKIPVEGTIVSLSAQHIAIRRKDERAGEVVVHFPRAGFLVQPAGP
jgi:glutathione S-transferase